MPDPISGRFEIAGTSSREVNITMDGDRGYITVGGEGREIITMDGDNGKLTVGGEGKDGEIRVNDENGNNRILIDGGDTRITVGGKDSGGEIILKNDKGKIVVRLEAEIGRFRAYNDAGKEIFCVLDNAHLHLGGHNKNGALLLKDSKQRNRVKIDSANGEIKLVGQNRRGDNTSLEDATIRLEGMQGNLWLGGNKVDGDIVMFSSDGDNTDHNDATIHLNGEKGDISLKGDIHLQGADCAENFPVGNMDNIEPGTVLVIGEDSSLTPCIKQFDKRVAGVVSGAGDCHPGIILNDQPSQPNMIPVALTGKVYCKVNNEGGHIEVGDMLTTSSKTGKAMKVSDPDQAFGAVLGKALLPMNEDSGLIPILVALH